jgi:hypothetical protein
MSLAAILGFYLLSLGSLSAGWLPPPAVTASTLPTLQSQDGSASSPPQTPPAQSPNPTQPLQSPTGTTPKSPAQAKLSPTRRHRTKKVPSNCSDAPTALNTAGGSPATATNSGTNDVGATPVDSGSAAPPKPCAPSKVVVKNGGSPEPTVQLKGGTAEEASHQRSTTNQLATATQENLKKIAGRQLNPSQQEMVSQIKEFMKQSKAAIAAGDLERGHNLALKAHLLSDELVKP